MSGSDISWVVCKSAPRSRQITTPALHRSVFTGRMPFLPPNQQRQSIIININITCTSRGVLAFGHCRRPGLPDRRVLVAVAMLLLTLGRIFHGRRPLLSVNGRMLTQTATTSQAPARPRTWLVRAVLIGRQAVRHSDVIVTSTRPPANQTISDESHVPCYHPVKTVTDLSDQGVITTNYQWLHRLPENYRYISRLFPVPFSNLFVMTPEGST